MAATFEAHIPLSVGTSGGLFTISTTSTSYVEPTYPHYANVDAANYTGSTLYYEAVMKTSAGTASAQLHTSAGAAVSGAEVTTTG